MGSGASAWSPADSPASSTRTSEPEWGTTTELTQGSVWSHSTQQHCSRLPSVQQRGKSKRRKGKRGAFGGSEPTTHCWKAAPELDLSLPFTIELSSRGDSKQIVQEAQSTQGLAQLRVKVQCRPRAFIAWVQDTLEGFGLHKVCCPGKCECNTRVLPNVTSAPGICPRRARAGSAPSLHPRPGDGSTGPRRRSQGRSQTPAADGRETSQAHTTREGEKS